MTELTGSFGHGAQCPSPAGAQHEDQQAQQHAEQGTDDEHVDSIRVIEGSGGNVRCVCGDRPPVVQVDRGRFGADRDVPAVEHRVRRPDVVSEGHCTFGLAHQRPAQHHLRQDCHSYPTQER